MTTETENMLLRAAAREQQEKREVNITINGRNLTPNEFQCLIETRENESLSDHAKRLAQTLGIGCVITRTR